MPVARSGAARRYAEAVFGIARDQGSFDRWADDLRSIARAHGDEEFARVLDSPVVEAAAKEAMLGQYLAGASREARNLARILLHKGRFALAPLIAEHYQELVNEHQGIATADVASAAPLTPDQLRAVEAKLSSMTGRRVVAQHRVDPSLLGGIVARVGDQLIDASVRGRLEALKRRLAAT